MKLAVYLLKDNNFTMTQSQIQKQIDKGKDYTIVLKKLVPVHVTYLTAWFDENEQLCFRNDIYDRDAIFRDYIRHSVPGPIL